MDQRFGTQVAEERPISGVNWDGKPLRKPSALAAVSFGELYIFLWKLLAASVAFALPFLIIFVLIMNAKNP